MARARPHPEAPQEAEAGRVVVDHGLPVLSTTTISASGSHEAHVAFGACFTPDSKKALLGTEDGGLVAWALDSGRPVGRVLGHVGPTLQVACSPKHEVIASGCSNVVLWIGPGDGDPAAAPATSDA